MPIKVGDRLPSAKFRVMGPEGPAWKNSDEVFKGKKVALFSMPGAFTGTCHRQHMPTIVGNIDALKAKGIDTIAVTTVNDAFVLGEWKKATGGEKVEFLGDGNAEFAKAIDLAADMGPAGMGTRGRRYSMLVDDGVVKSINIDEPGKFEVSSGDKLLQQL
jgi:glutaredoxin/glutathione-dependent peroxiredoxin